MSDNKNFEQEYQYVDESGIDKDQQFSENPGENPKTNPESQKEYLSKINSIIQQPNIRRNGLIAIAGLLFLIFILKYMGKDDISKKNANPAPPEATKINVASTNPMLQAPVADKLPSMVDQSNQADRIANIEQNLQSNIESMQDKIAQLSSEVNTLATTNQALTQQMTDLASKLLASQQALEELLAAKKAQPVIPKSQANMKKALPKSESLAYFVQAVIPGRAWLINSQGGTLTVRVGSKVPGWGVVHRIDALQGRVTMSSGRIIAFTQAD